MAPSATTDAVNGVNGVNGHRHVSTGSESTEEPYTVLEQYHSQRSRLRVACIGAGASGLCLAYKMEKMLRRDTWDLVLYDKNPHLGGTWYENTYPGVACDIPSHLYTFTFDPKPDWSQFFASGTEIQRYLEDFADRHNSHRYMQLNTKVIEAQWDEQAGAWNIILENTTTGERNHDWAHILINGSGILNTWKWPEIDGLHSFGGPLMHSAKWDHSVDFAGKTVGIIGTGSSSLQIVPQLQKICSKVDVYMRSPTWVSPPFGAGVLKADLLNGEDDNPGQRQFNFTEEHIRKFKEDPSYHLDFRKRMEAEINGNFTMFKEESELSKKFTDVITKEMHRRIGDGYEDLKKFIIPTWAPGCRRISPADGFLEALVQPNVDCIFSEITKVVPKGIVTADGNLHEHDIVVCATGFAVAFKPNFRVINAAGKTIHEDWINGPNLYMGLAAPRFPNYFTIVGPGATWSNGTLLPSIETTIEYAVKVMDKMQAEHIKAIEVKQEALDDLYGHFDEFHKTTVWKQECRSWFKDGKIKNRIYLWPGPTIHFLKSIKNPRYEDYNIRYRYNNRFAFLGNGDVKASKGGDILGLSTYVRDSDHEWDVE